MLDGSAIFIEAVTYMTQSWSFTGLYIGYFFLCKRAKNNHQDLHLISKVVGALLISLIWQSPIKARAFIRDLTDSLLLKNLLNAFAWVLCGIAITYVIPVLMQRLQPNSLKTQNKK